MSDRIQLVSTAGTGHARVTTRNKKTAQGKLELRKYDPIARRHVLFVERKIARGGRPGRVR